MGNASKRHQPRDGKRAIVYTRQSTSREDSISIELQTEECERFCRRHDYRVVASGPPVSDPGVSGLQFEKRPGIKRAIELIENGEADVLVVYRWTRLSRKRTHQAVIMDRIERAGGRVECATEPIDTTTAGGRFSREVLLAMAAFESDQKSEQWREAQARRVDMGLPAGGAPPLGYAKNGRAAFVPDPVYGPIVREMYDAYLRGVGPQGIAKSLNQQRGLSTPRGKPFTVSTIARALDSGFAAGLLDVHDPECDCPTDDVTGRRTCRPARRVKIPGTHEPLIDADVWQAYLRERAKRRQVNPKVRQPRWWLGAGLTVCGRCDGHMVVDSYRSAKSQAICSTYRGKPGTCEGSWIDRVNLETLVALWLGGHVEDWANAAETMTGTDADDRARLAREIDRARADEAKLRDGLRRAARLVATGDMTDEDYHAARADVDDQLAQVTRRLAYLQSRLDALDPQGDAYDRLARALGHRAEGGTVVEQPMSWAVTSDITDWPPEQTAGVVPPEEFNALLKRVIGRVVVNERTIVIEPWRGAATTYDRAKMLPPRRRTDVQPRDEDTGRFVKTTTA